MEIKVDLNIKPLSVNAAWQGRRFKSPAYKEYENLMMYLLPAKKKISGPVAVHFNFYLKNANRIDIDNCLKQTLDCLVKREYIDDDRLVFHLSAEKHKSEKDRMEITISSCG